MTPRPRCWRCRAILELDVGRPVPRSETCPECDADIRACKSCINWNHDFGTCREPSAEVPEDPEKQNFCSFFQLAAPKVAEETAAPADARDDALKKLEALFGKKR